MQKRAACLLILNENTLDIRVVNRRNSSLIGLPGGKLNENEDTLSCAIRETFEETGLSYNPEDCSLFLEATDGDFLVTTYIVIDNNLEPSVGSEPDIGSFVVNWTQFVYNSAFENYNKSIIAKLTQLTG